jgi:hypothetical protein
MKILVKKQEFVGQEFTNTFDDLNVLDSSTSVNQVKSHYFESLSKLGEIILIDDTYSKEELTVLCQQSNTLFATFHEDPPEGLSCRLMEHTKGSLMLTGGFMSGWNFHATTMNLVTSSKQASQLEKGLGKATPNIGVFVPRLAEHVFRIPTATEALMAKMQYKVEQDCYHIVYAGRFISNKGIIQLVRACSLWPIPSVRITLVGDFEDDFYIYQSNATHTTFRDYFKREVLQYYRNIQIVTIKSLPPKKLCELFWTVDCFVYPSFHEDENFGITPREAMLCGVPFVVSDFCGLGQLKGAQGGIVNTFPTLGGVRYSLYELWQAIESTRLCKHEQKVEYKVYNATFVAKECDTQQSLRALRFSAEKLLELPLGNAPKGGWRSKDRVERWKKNGPKGFKKAIKLAKKPIPEGLYVDGTGTIGCGWFSEPHFLTAIQSLYTSYPETPKVIKNSCYRGFWRLAIWDTEMALVEFGYPGPRVKRFNEKDWEELSKSIVFKKMGEVEFYPKNKYQIDLIHNLVQLGYLVPDQLF